MGRREASGSLRPAQTGTAGRGVSVHPVLLTIPGVDWPLHTYGVLIVCGFVAAMYVAWREAKRQNRYADDVLDFAFWALLGGMIGARIVFIGVNWKQYFVTAPWETLGPVSASLVGMAGGVVVLLIGVMGLGTEGYRAKAFVGAGALLMLVGKFLVGDTQLGPIDVPSVFVVWKGGLVFYGAAIGGFVSFLIFARSRNIRGADMLKLADMCIAGLPLAAGFGRLGCVAAGCCWGAAAYTLDDGGHFHSTLPFALEFPKGALAYQSLLTTADSDVVAAMKAAGHTAPLVPIQLIDSLGEIGLFFALIFVRSRKWFHGQVLLTYGLLYPLWRTVLELFRGDGERGYLIPGLLSTSQFISLCLAFTSLVAIVVIRRRALARPQLLIPT